MKWKSDLKPWSGSYADVGKALLLQQLNELYLHILPRNAFIFTPNIKHTPGNRFTIVLIRSKPFRGQSGPFRKPFHAESILWEPSLKRKLSVSCDNSTH